ncbi:MAG: ASKHA domain-containing protein [Acidimicrobiia bacterium]|nr:MAG: ASKHA domain-containing protein [Acidimicrobiia bacterium]
MGEATPSGSHELVFQPSGVRGRVKAGTSIRRAATSLGVEIESICADVATCGKCRVLIEDGHLGNIDSSPDHASSMRPTEELWITRRAKTWRKMGLDPDRLRLSCQAEIQGDMVVFVPESSRGNRQIIRKAATDRHIDIHPAVRRYYLELEPATLEDPLGDVERVSESLVAAMSRIHGDTDWVAPDPKDMWFDFHVIRTMGDAIREGDWKVSLTVWQGLQVIDIRPGYHDDLYGIAVDIGSTAIAIYICDLVTGEIVGTDSMMNPQTAFGDDIMSRMTYESQNEDGLATLQDAVITGLNKLITRALRTNRIKPNDVHEIAVVGNTTMHHLFLGISTKHLSTVPFVPTSHRAFDIKARDLGIAANPSANVHVLPIAASFVGADAMAVIIAEEPHKQDENLLIIDIGTNAELIAGNRNGLVCTSTPTGPAFEGAHIEYGMRAADGAIERVEIDPDTLEPRYKVIGTDGWGPHELEVNDSIQEGGPVKGLCGSAIIDAVAEMFRTGIITPRGHFASDLKTERVRQGELGWEYVIAWSDETSINRDIPITLDDVRQIQLAKAALYTASIILLRELGIETPDKIILAGAFGSRIDKTKAMMLGMIPDCPLDRVFSVGNAAGDGARIALLNRHKRLEAQEIARTIRRVELPVDPAFQSEYMQALNLPHMSHQFSAIADLIPDYGPDPMAKRFRNAF